MWDFVKRHKLLSALFVVSVFLMVKNSSIPYPFNPPLIIQYIFDAPTSEFFSKVAGMVDIFTSAYVTSLLFYFIVDYIPAIKQEETAKKIIAPKLISIYLYISKLTAMIDYSAQQQGLNVDADCKQLDKLRFEDVPVYCKEKTFVDGAERGSTPSEYNLLKDCNKYRKLILTSCQSISVTPSFSYCDEDIINMISQIQLNEFLSALPTPDDMTLKVKMPISHFDLGKKYLAFVKLKESLSSLVDTRHEYLMNDISEEEILKWQGDCAKILTENPEVAKLLALQKMQDG